MGSDWLKPERKERGLHRPNRSERPNRTGGRMPLGRAFLEVSGLAPRGLLGHPDPANREPLRRCASNGSRLAEWYATPQGCLVGSGETRLPGGVRGWPRSPRPRKPQGQEGIQEPSATPAGPTPRGVIGNARRGPYLGPQEIACTIRRRSRPRLSFSGQPKDQQ